MDTKEALLEATQELLWDLGYIGMSPKAILRRSGVGQGSLYHYFEGKPDLARAAIERSVEKMQAENERDLSSNGPAKERIARYLCRKRDVLRGCRAGRLVYDPEVITNPVLRQPLEKVFAKLQMRLVEILELGMARNEFARTFDAHAIATTIVASTQGGYILARVAQSPEPFEQAVKGLQELLDSLLAPS